jgi:hypothetical protein
MTQEQALEVCKTLFPDAEIQLERTHSIGVKRGHVDEFQVWDWSGKLRSLATSRISWEHCIDILKPQAESNYEKDTSPVEASAE